MPTVEQNLRNFNAKNIAKARQTKTPVSDVIKKPLFPSKPPLLTAIKPTAKATGTTALAGVKPRGASVTAGVRPPWPVMAPGGTRMRPRGDIVTDEVRPPKPVETQPVQPTAPKIGAREGTQESTQAYNQKIEDRATAQIEPQKQKFEELFRGDLQGYKKNLQDVLMTSAEQEGKTIDFENEKLVTAISELDKAVMDGYMTREDDYSDQYKRLVSLFTQGKQAEDAPVTAMKTLPDLKYTGATVSGAPLDVQINQNAKLTMANAIQNIDGSLDIPITDLVNAKITTGGNIDFTAFDTSVLTFPDIERIQMLLSKDITNDNAKLQDEILKAQRDRILAQEDALKFKFESLYAGTGNEMNQRRIEQEYEYEFQSQTLEMDKAESLDALKEAQQSALSYHKMRLSAWGASDSVTGVMAVTDLEMKYAKTFIQTSQKYDFHLKDLSIRQNHLKDSFVIAMTNLKSQQQRDEIDMQMQLNDKLGAIDDSRLMNLQDKENKMFEIQMSWLDGVKTREAERQQQEQNRIKELKDEAKELMKWRTESLGFMHTIDENGNVVLDTNSDGEPILTVDGENLYLDTLKRQSADDKQLSELTGMVYVGGEPAINPQTGEFMPTVSLQTLAVRQSELNLSERKFGLTGAKFDWQMVQDSLPQYDIKTDENGEFVYMPKNPNATNASFAFAGEQGMQMLDFLNTAERNANNPALSKGGQCGSFCNNALRAAGMGGVFGDLYKDKAKNINYSVAEFQKNPVEGFAIYDKSVAPPYGHVSAIRIGQDGEPYVVDSNSKNNERIDVRKFGENPLENKITGFYVPDNMRGVPDSNGMIRTGIFDKTTKKSTEDQTAEEATNLMVNDAFLDLFDEKGQYTAVRPIDITKKFGEMGITLGDKDIMQIQELKKQLEDTPAEFVYDRINQYNKYSSEYMQKDLSTTIPWYKRGQEQDPNDLGIEFLAGVAEIDENTGEYMQKTPEDIVAWFNEKAKELEEEEGIQLPENLGRVLANSASKLRKEFDVDRQQTLQRKKPAYDFFNKILSELFARDRVPIGLDSAIGEFFANSELSAKEFQDEITLIREAVDMKNLKDLPYYTPAKDEYWATGMTEIPRIYRKKLRKAMFKNLNTQ